MAKTVKKDTHLIEKKVSPALEKKFYILFGIYIMAIILANILGSKIAAFRIFGFTLFEASVGIITVPLMFLITDIVSEVYGKGRSYKMVRTGMVVLAITLLIVMASVALPAASRKLADPVEYQHIFGSSFRIFFASIVAFFLAQMHDVWSYNLLKKATKGKYMWLRNNLSNFGSEFIDSTVFMLLAFLWASPHMTFSYVFVKLTLPYYVLKVLFSIAQTPLCYLGVWWLRREGTVKG